MGKPTGFLEYTQSISGPNGGNRKKEDQTFQRNYIKYLAHKKNSRNKESTAAWSCGVPVSASQGMILGGKDSGCTAA